MKALRRLSDPFASGVAVAVGLVLAGFFTIALGWRGLAATTFVPEQLAWIASGALAAVAMIGVGLAVLSVQIDRRDEARRRALIDSAIDDAASTLVSVHRTTMGRVSERPSNPPTIRSASGSSQTAG